MATQESIRSSDPIGTFTRRTFFVGLAGAGLYAASPEPVRRALTNSFRAGLNEWKTYDSNRIVASTPPSTPEPPRKIDLPLPIVDGAITPTPKEVQNINRLVSIPLFSEERLHAEEEEIQKVTSPRDINLALWGVHRVDNRVALRDLRYEMRQSRTDGLTYLDENRIAWANDHGIHPETLGLAMDFYPTLRKTLAQLFPNENQNMYMMGTGTGTMLMHSETGGLVNIGTKLAMSQINEASWPGEKAKLAEYINRVNRNYGTNYNALNIPGSAKGDEDSSGGAIGSQAMPSNALSYDNFYKTYLNRPFNLFDPYTSFEFAWIYVARMGYVRGDDAKMYKALMGWNPLPSEMNPVLAAGKDYSNRFINDITKDY